MSDRTRRALALAAIAASTFACASSPPEELTSTARYDTVTDLPPPDTTGSWSLEATLSSRRSGREFDSTPLTDAEIGQLLWSAQGITDDRGHRTVPSAGATYPLEIYVVTDDSVLHYLPNGHRVERRDDASAAARLANAAPTQDHVDAAPAVVAIAAVFARTEAEYGERGEPFVEREAGHAAQNLLLQATALGLEAVPGGGFDAEVAARAMALPGHEEVLYMVPVGHPPGS